MRKFQSNLLALSLLATTTLTMIPGTVAMAAEETGESQAVVTSDEHVYGYENNNTKLNLDLYARYNANGYNADGGCMEIVEYNEKNGFVYSISGQKGYIVAIDIKSVTSEEKVVNLSGTEYDVKPLVEEIGAEYGDITSVAISPDGTKLAAAIQHEEYNKAGYVVVFQCEADGTLTNPVLYNAGVQPDMVTFANNSIVLSADEGEPRNGFSNGAVDPKGTVTIINLEDASDTQVDFSKFTADELVADNILLNRVDGIIQSPSKDLEPEYMTVSSDGTTAYVVLQEANAIAVLDIQAQEFTGIYSCGYEDYSKIAVDIMADGTYNATTYENLLGARMPDGVAIYETNGATYLVAANEGDSREWGDFSNELKTEAVTGEKLTTLDPSATAGIPEGKTVLFGGRSFTMYKVTSDGLSEVFDSGNDFEALSAYYLPDYFNCSNDDIEIDSRSTKKGPESENITVGVVDGRTYAFIAIERIGGIMVYDITKPTAVKYTNYINSREFASAIQGDVAPEGLCVTKETESGKAILIVAYEVSGTLSAYELSAYKELSKGETFTVDGANYKVTKKGDSVEFTGMIDETETAVIPDVVTYYGVSYKVTSVAAKAFYENDNITSVTIGGNVTKIGSKAFTGCSNLSNIVISGKNLTSVGTKAFREINKKAVVTVPSGKVKAYKKLLKASGLPDTVQVIK